MHTVINLRGASLLARPPWPGKGTDAGPADTTNDSKISKGRYTSDPLCAVGNGRGALTLVSTGTPNGCGRTSLEAPRDQWGGRRLRGAVLDPPLMLERPLALAAATDASSAHSCS